MEPELIDEYLHNSEHPLEFCGIGYTFFIDIYGVLVEFTSRNVPQSEFLTVIDNYFKTVSKEQLDNLISEMRQDAMQNMKRILQFVKETSLVLRHKNFFNTKLLEDESDMDIDMAEGDWRVYVYETIILLETGFYVSHGTDIRFEARVSHPNALITFKFVDE